MEAVNRIKLADGQKLNVPESDMPEFEKRAAEEGMAWSRARVYRTAAGETLTVPENEVPQFEETARAEGLKYEPVRKVSVGGKTLSVPQSEAKEFLKIYHSAPETTAERAADRARAVKSAGDPGSVVGAVLRGAAEGVLDAPGWWVDTVKALPAAFREGVNQATAMGADGDAALGILSADEADAAQSAYRDKASKGGSDDTARRWFEEAAKMTGQQVSNLSAAGTTAGAVGVSAAGSGVGAPAAIPAAAGAGAVMLTYGIYRQAAGEIYREARDQGLEHGMSRAVALAAAVPFAAMEKFQLTKAAQSFGLGAVKGGLVRRIASVLGAAGVRTLQEAGTEGAQETLKQAAVDAGRVIDGQLAAAGVPAKLMDDFRAGVEEFKGTLGPMAVMQFPGAAAGSARAAGRLWLEGPEAADRAAYREAMRGSTGAAAEAEAQRKDEGERGKDEGGTGGTPNAERGTPNDEGGTGGKTGGTVLNGVVYGGEKVSDGGEEKASGGQVERRVTLELMPPAEDGSRAEGIEERADPDGRKVRGVRLLMPDGRVRFDVDPGLVALAEYWGRDRALLPAPAPAAETEAEGGAAVDPREAVGQRLGWDAKPGKSVLVKAGRSPKLYPARVVEVIDARTVRVKISKNTRSVKNNRAGYADVDVGQLQQYRSAEVMQKINERMAGMDPAERGRVKAAARRFRELLMEGDEIVDQEALEASGTVPGRSGGVLRTELMREAYARAGAFLGADGPLDDPFSQAAALPALEEWMERQRGGAPGMSARMWEEQFAAEAAAERKEEGGRRKDEGGTREGEGFALESLTPEQMEETKRGDAQKLEEAARRGEMRRRAAAPLEGTAGDMTGTLPGMEGTSDVPLFTEQGDKVLAVTDGKENLSDPIDIPPEEDAPMSLRRIIIGVVGQMRNPVFGGSVVSVPRFGEYYATRQNTSAGLMAVVASMNPKILKKYGLIKFDSYAAALRYARGIGDTTGERMNPEADAENRGGERGAARGVDERIGGVRVTPHRTYNQDESAGMEGDGMTVAPVAGALPGVGMDLRDAVSLYREFKGAVPRVRKTLTGRALGVYRLKDGNIEILATALGLVDAKDKENIRARLAARGMTEEEIGAALPAELNALVEIRRNQRMKMPVKVLTHELGHLIDALPEGSLRGRGNIMGHIAALHKYLKHSLPREPGAPGEVTADERRRMWSEAEKLAERDIGPAREWIEEIRREVKETERLPVKAEDIRAILGIDGRERTPEFYVWFARQDAKTKKDVLRRAMRGLVDERAAAEGAVRTVTRMETVGTRVRREGGYTRADVAKRFGELLRKATADLMLIEREAIVGEAREAFPAWRGEGAYKSYFDDPAEMYAEFFGMFLSDPAWMEARCPTAFRAFKAYMDVRPEAAAAYGQWLRDKLSGAVNRKHMAALTSTMTNASDSELGETRTVMAKPTASQEWQALRFAFDTRNGPIYVAVRKIEKEARREIRRATRSGEITREEAARRENALTVRKAELVSRVKFVRHGMGEVAMMAVDVKGRVRARLDAAGVDWITFDTYAALNRIRYELQGRAAPGGIMPETAKEMLAELTAGMGEAQKAALSEAWKEFRGIYEDLVIEAEGMRNFLGDALHDLLRENKFYVTFRHRPTREDIASMMEERRKAGEAAVAAGKPFEDGTTRFDIIASALGAGKGSLGAKIYPLTGSFDPIASAIVQTLQKGAALLQALHINNAKLRVRDFMRDYGYASYLDVEIKRAKDGTPIIPKDSTKRFGYVTYIEGGEIKMFRTDYWVEMAFEDPHGDTAKTLNVFMRLNNVMAGLQTRLRYGFWERAYAKDTQAAIANIPGMTRHPLSVVLRMVPKIPYLGAPINVLTRFIPPAAMQRIPRWLVSDRAFERWEGRGWATARLLKRGDIESHLRDADELEKAGRLTAADELRAQVLLLRRGMKMGITMQQQDLVPPSVGATPFDRHLMKFGLTSETRRETDTFVRNTLPRVLRQFFRDYEGQGEIRENAVKFATLAYLDKNRPDLTDAQKMVMVSDWGGSPDFSERSIYARYIEFASGSFLNARKEGVKRSFTALADHPAEFIAKKLAYTVAPAMARAALATGLASYVVRLMIPDPEERENHPLWRFCEFCRRGYSHVSDYLMKSYEVTILPVDMGGKAAFVMTLPLDEAEMVWNDLAVTAIEVISEQIGFEGRAGLKTPTPINDFAKRRATDLILPISAGGGILLNAIMPFVRVAAGQNTYDDFRQRNVLTQDELDARFETWDATGALLRHAYNSSVGGLIKRWERPDDDPQSFGRLHEVLSYPGVQPSVGSFLRVVSNGQRQMADTALEISKMGQPAARLEAKRILRESLKAGTFLLPEFEPKILNDEYIREYYMREYTETMKRREKRSTPFLVNAMKADDPATMGRLIDMHGNYQ